MKGLCPQNVTEQAQAGACFLDAFAGGVYFFIGRGAALELRQRHRDLRAQGGPDRFRIKGSAGMLRATLSSRGPLAGSGLQGSVRHVVRPSLWITLECNGMAHEVEL
ncbi:MAG: hypothetical protein WDO56_16600 [Gammaproteobacteria bacterium]